MEERPGELEMQMKEVEAVEDCLKVCAKMEVAWVASCRSEEVLVWKGLQERSC
jgi:hypothetical protein